MAGDANRHPRSKGWLVLMLTVGLLQMPILAQGFVVDTETSLATGIETNLGGRSLLVEELTTTWCPTCAEIDPYLMGVSDAHGSRIALMAYHPSDGEDAFSPPASDHRIDRLKAVNPELPGTPSFIVEGRAFHTGTEAWVDVQRDILDAEVERQMFTKLQFTVKSNGDNITATLVDFDGHAKNNSQLTFLVLEHEKTVPKGAVNPGGPTRDRVVIATSECDIASGEVIESIDLIEAVAPVGCTTDFSITFEALESFSVVLVHENTFATINTTEDLGSYGAVEFAYRERSETQSWNSAWVVLFCAGMAGLLIFPKKNKISAPRTESPEKAV